MYTSILATWDNGLVADIGTFTSTTTGDSKTVSNSKLTLDKLSSIESSFNITSNSLTPLGTKDIIFDMFFEGNRLPNSCTVYSKGGSTNDSILFQCDSKYNATSLVLALFGNFKNPVWNISNNTLLQGTDIRPLLTNGTNHMAIGRQSGIWQVWINGTRVYRANNNNNTAYIPYSINRIVIGVVNPYQTAFVLNDIRLTPNVNIYGDSATITVPSLPLTAI